MLFTLKERSIPREGESRGDFKRVSGPPIGLVPAQQETFGTHGPLPKTDPLRSGTIWRLSLSLCLSANCPGVKSPGRLAHSSSIFTCLGQCVNQTVKRGIHE